MYSYLGRMYDTNGKWMRDYRFDDQMTAVELREKAQKYQSRYFQMIDRNAKLAERYLSLAEKYYTMAQSR